MRFLRLELGFPTPDEGTIRDFRNRMFETKTLKLLGKPFDRQLRKKGYNPMSGQIDDVSLVPALKQPITDAEKEAIMERKTADVIWLDNPAKTV